MVVLLCNVMSTGITGAVVVVGANIVVGCSRNDVTVIVVAG